VAQRQNLPKTFDGDNAMHHVTRTAAGFFLFFLLFAPAASADSPGTIAVSGQGEVHGAPDQAVLSTGVTTTATTAASALAENAVKMNAVFATLKRLGVAEKSIQTSNFSVSPQYPPYNANTAGTPRIVGYQVSNQVTVTLDDTKKLGPTLDALVAAGSNQINSVGFAIKDPTTLLSKARELAVADAIARAQTYAKAAGVTLGPILSIQEGFGETPRPLYNAMMVSAERAAPTPVAPGEQSVTANVTVIFQIK
jgi:uncharacterized protein YggE